MARVLAERRRLLPGAETLTAWGGLAAVAAYLAVLAWAMQHTSYDVWGGLLVFPVLVAVSLPVIWRVVRDDDPPLVALLGAALVAKLAASFARYFVAFTVYGGSSDAVRYHAEGSQIAEAFHAGRLPLLDLVPSTQGTPFVSELTGLVYTVTGPSRLAGFLVFSWLGFWGLFLTYRAALVGFPELDRRRLALLLFFLPSLLFWPSSIGKESWMMLGLGVTAWGAARLLTHQRFGIAAAALGSVLTAYVRPHFTLIAAAALAVAYVLRRGGDRASAVAPVKKLVGVAVLVVGLAVAVSQVSSFLGDRGQDEGGLTAVLDSVNRQTTQGGSATETFTPNSPLEFPFAFVSVMFRPTLLEVRNGTTFIAALETTVLAVVVLLSWSRLKTLPRWLARRPYLVFCLLYAAMFAFAWSSIGNLGILARQRSLAWPFLLIVLALPRPAPKPEPPVPSARVARRALPPPAPPGRLPAPWAPPNRAERPLA